MATKLDKKELLEPDKLQIFLLSVRAFMETHRKQIYVGAGLFLLIIILSGGWYLYQLNYETSAANLSNRVFDAAIKAGSQSGDTAAIQGYKDLLSRYPGSDAAIIAYYRLGNLYFNQHDFDAAIVDYQEFLKNVSPNSDLITLAHNGLGNCYEAKKDFTKALEYYEKAAKTVSASSFEALNYLNIARMHEELKNNVRAVEYYRKSLDKTSDSLQMLYLKRKISSLG
jgi:TolA-binding protein